ncbi:unnamed protein product [Ilex paraguariensis]|uniref:Uncharacterized protein n=1 Tax=Ilex paraguariensis TaxID=185542 RepID=A0ABC8T5C1_9AQUA
MNNASNKKFLFSGAMSVVSSLCPPLSFFSAKEENHPVNHVFPRCSTVKKLFDGYDDLVTGFNSFLPAKKKLVATSSEAYNSTVDDQAPTSSRTTQTKFVKKVQKSFGDEVRRNKLFLDALGMWRFGDMVIDRLDQEVADVFKELPDLYIEFKGFYGDFSEEKSTDKEKATRPFKDYYTDWFNMLKCRLMRERKEGVKKAVGEAVVAEMMSVFMDANRLRRSVLTEILNVTNVFQAALFLEGLAQFLIGFQEHKILSEFERSKMAIN